MARSLSSHLKGYLISCDQGKMGQSVKEVLDLLNRVADTLEVHPASSSKELTLEEELKSELTTIKTQKNRRFYKMSTDAQGSFFLKIATDAPYLQDPASFLSTVFNHFLKDGGILNSYTTRFTAKIVPIDCTCQAAQEDMTEMAKSILPKYFDVEEGQKFKIELRRRLNTKVDRDKFTGTLVKLACTTGKPSHRVDLKQPDLVIIVDVIKMNAFLGVHSKEYFPHGFNIRTLSKKRESLSVPPMMPLNMEIVEVDKKKTRGKREKKPKNIDGPTPEKKMKRTRESTEEGPPSKKLKKVKEKSSMGTGEALLGSEVRVVKAVGGRRELDGQVQYKVKYAKSYLNTDGEKTRVGWVYHSQLRKCDDLVEVFEAKMGTLPSSVEKEDDKMEVEEKKDEENDESSEDDGAFRLL